MSTIAAAMLAGAGVGLSIAAPIGPTSMLCIQRTLAAGLQTGLTTGLGVATVHLTYGALALISGKAFAEVWSDTALLSIASGAVLLAFAVRVLRRAVVMGLAGERRRGLVTTYCGAVGFGFLNPITPILFAVATPALLGQAAAPVPLLAAGVFAGSLGWWVVLSTAVALLRGRLTSRCMNVANKAAGLLLAALAVSMMIKGFAIGLGVLPASGAPAAALAAPSVLGFDRSGR